MLSYLSYLSVLLDHPVCSEYVYLPLLLKALYAHEMKSATQNPREFAMQKGISRCENFQS